MSVKIFDSRNVHSVGTPSGAGPASVEGICVGLVVEWARKVLAGVQIELSKPRERASRELAVHARAFQVRCWQQGRSAVDLRDAWDGALARTGLMANSLPTGFMNGPQLLNRLAHEIPAGGLYVVSIARPAQLHAPVIYHGVALMRQPPGVEPGPLLLFDPGYGLYQCDSAQDFVATTEYFNAYTEPAWAYALRASPADRTLLTSFRDV